MGQVRDAWSSGRVWAIGDILSDSFGDEGG
jgi:hypothetical protein